MAGPSTPVIATFPVPPPVFNFPWGMVGPGGTVMLTPMSIEFLQILWASIQGAGGIIDIVTVEQPGGAIIGPAGAESIAQQAVDEGILRAFLPRAEAPDHSFGVNFSKADISTATVSTGLGRSPSPLNWRIPANMARSYGVVQTAPSADTTFDLQVDGVSIGSATWQSGQNTAVFTKASATYLRAQHDWLDLVAPPNLNGMAGLFGLAVMGERSW